VHGEGGVRGSTGRTVKLGKPAGAGERCERRDWLKPGDPRSRRNQHDPHRPGIGRKEKVMARARWKLLVPTATLTLVPFTLQMPVASAFFPPVVPPPPVRVVPPATPPIVVPPVNPPPIVVPPVAPPPIIVVPPTSPPSGVPEPSTLATGLAGLSVAAGWAARRRRKS
jgi:hypothetical protein